MTQQESGLKGQKDAAEVLRALLAANGGQLRANTPMIVPAEVAQAANKLAWISGASGGSSDPTGTPPSYGQKPLTTDHGTMRGHTAGE